MRYSLAHVVHPHEASERSVLFEFQDIPPRISLIHPVFVVKLNIETSKVLEIIDPYDGSLLMMNTSDYSMSDISNAMMPLMAAPSATPLSRLVRPMDEDGLKIFNRFGREPMGRQFNVTINSDAANLRWTLYSSWVPGDPSNP